MYSLDLDIFFGVNVICQGQGHIFQQMAITGVIMFHKYSMIWESVFVLIGYMAFNPLPHNPNF